MGLNNNDNRATFVNISEGRLYTKEKGDKERSYFTDIDGTITKVEFKNEEYQGQHFEITKIHLVDKEDKYILQMRTDSGYFRGFCNSLKSSPNPTEKINIAPSSKEKDGKPQTTCFVKQYGRALKHAHTQANPGDLPQVKAVEFKGKTQWDGTEQIAYWKKWLSGIQWEHEFIASSSTPQQTTERKQTEETYVSAPDDLPF